MPGAQQKRDRQGPRRGRGGSTADPAGPAGPAAYDGPGSNAGEARGRSGSVAGTRSSSRPGSQVRGSSQARQAVDPARDPVPQVLLRNVDFGGAAYNIFSQVSSKFASLPRSLSHSALLIHISLCDCVSVCSNGRVLRLSTFLACQKCENECWLASFYHVKRWCFVTFSASHFLLTQPHSDSSFLFIPQCSLLFISQCSLLFIPQCSYLFPIHTPERIHIEASCTI